MAISPTRLTLAVALLLAPATTHAAALAQAFAEGHLAAAEQAGPPRDDADREAQCELRLFQNRLPEAIACLRQDQRSNRNKRLLGLALFRAGDFTSAAQAFSSAALPARAAEARALANQPSYVIHAASLPARIEFLRTDPLPILAITLPDGKRHHFVLDTGAAETIIDPSLAGALHIAEDPMLQTGTFAGGKTAPFATGMLASLTLGPVTLSHLPVQVLSTNSFKAAVDDASIEGVLGVDVLRHFSVTIDYPGGALLLDRPGAPLPPNATTMPMWIAGDHFILAAGALNGAPQLALIDTGLAGGGCTAPESTLKAASVALTIGTETGYGAGGPVAARAFTARSISLGPITRPDIPCFAGVFPPSLETATGARIGLLISHDFLRPYRVHLNFQQMRLAIARSP
jgi:predicted aspartyl protease